MPDLDLEKRRLLNKEETLVCIMPRRKRPSDNTDSEDEFDDAKHPQRNAANARERARMRVLSKAFCRLKTTLPWVPADTKLSKLDTLRLATSYIAHLRAILMDQPISNEHTHKHPLALTWPFSFQRPDSSTDVIPEHQEPNSPWLDLPQNNPVNRDKDVSYFY
ncbi:transcription factor 21 isoform X2 [Agrilus planipennis]|uniref:Transcription factor 21 isoform X2 n=1 Tax=Agrilus planipennis TaxID=224129 RepID=A0A1W4XEK4_AGRPL|nr:transcription factor 21 isoform X2 [Agrilus planipennis]XP_018334444.1 transcription factor 21 isoform X2 [Agrilus planipennis]